MSKLREVAEEALRWMEHARLHLTIKERMHPDGLGLYDNAAEALRAALAQPETESEPVAWQWRYILPAGPSGWLDRGSEHDWHDVPAEDVAHYANRSDVEVRPLYANPPRDEWRPEDGRRYRYLKSFCSPMGLDADNNHPWTCRINPSRMRGASVDEALDAAMERDGWRDVTSPMEAPIAAKCQRIEGSGEICGLTPPCPDCGSSLIDVPEGSL
jgi:hypothetical protein